MPTSLDFSAVQPPANGLEKKNPTKHAKTSPKPTREPENTGILETRFQLPHEAAGMMARGTDYRLLLIGDGAAAGTQTVRGDS